MARFDPFRGVRYAGQPLDRVIAPPYDVVDPAERALLAARSPYNAVHLELPEPDPATGADRYAAAASLLRTWVGSGVLAADAVPALYPYRTTTPEGRSSTGVLGALSIGDDVLPHEETLPKPRSDRLDLQRATAANLSPIWALSLTRGLTDHFAPDGPPVADVVDDDGVRHQLWVVADADTIAAVGESVAGAPLVLADGHHRYETAKAYRAEARAAHGDRPGPYDAVLALVVELTAEQLAVGPIHRLVHGLDSPPDVPATFGPWFAAEPAGPLTEEVVAPLARARELAVLTPHGVWRLARRPPGGPATRPAGDPPAGTLLDAAAADRAVDTLAGAERSYDDRWEAVLAAVRCGVAQAGILLRPVTVEQIAEHAAAGRRMPPKTTFFTPKPRSGMVYRLLT
ncbi:MAG: DUF1015 family protein [Acidimicrobiales bacterium]